MNANGRSMTSSLQARARAEASQIDAVRGDHADRVFLASWLPDEPVGRRQLRRPAYGPVSLQAT